ncbi:MAG: nucleoside-diphosphate kinase [Patescibacteria group bacterium]|nr:nucleoside-diphosphate kinase [Patescibacteria group bacterium]
MTEHIERTLVLLKPDAVERGLMGRIIERFEDAGFKIVAVRLTRPNKEMGLKHYDEDVSKRNGEHIREYNVEFLTSGPVLAMVVEGVNAVENVRKFCGTTEPKSAPPGTIRGDFSHVSYGHADTRKQVIKNVVHASGDKEYAEKEIGLWFNGDEIIEYESVHEKHTR